MMVVYRGDGSGAGCLRLEVVVVILECMMCDSGGGVVVGVVDVVTWWCRVCFLFAVAGVARAWAWR